MGGCVKLKPVLVTTDAQWELLRLIRNACRDGFTHSTKAITEEQQKEYALKCATNPYLRHYLFYDAENFVVGFSRLEWRDGYVYPTYGVSPQARGKGYAWEVVKHTMLAAGGPLKGDLLDTNEAIKKVDYTLGWRPVGPVVDGVQQVEADWPPTFAKNLFT